MDYQPLEPSDARFLTARESLLKEIGMNLLKSPPIKLNSMPKLSFDPSGTKQSSVKYLYVHAFFQKHPAHTDSIPFPAALRSFTKEKSTQGRMADLHQPVFSQAHLLSSLWILGIQTLSLLESRKPPE